MEIRRYKSSDQSAVLELHNRGLNQMGALRKTSNILAEVKRMRVHPDYQGNGYGQKIYECLKVKANELGYKKLHLDTTTKQLPAQRLYEKFGFKEVQRKIIKDLELIFYEKYLN